MLTAERMRWTALVALFVGGCRGAADPVAPDAMAASPLQAMTMSLASDGVDPTTAEIVDVMRKQADDRGYRLVPGEQAEIIVTCRSARGLDSPEDNGFASHYVETVLWPQPPGDVQVDVAWVTDVRVLVDESSPASVRGVRVQLGPNGFEDPRIDPATLMVIANDVSEWATDAASDEQALVAARERREAEETPVRAVMAQPEQRIPTPRPRPGPQVEESRPTPARTFVGVAPDSVATTVVVSDDGAYLTEGPLADFLEQEARLRCGVEVRDGASATLALSVAVTSSTLDSTEVSAISVLLALEQQAGPGAAPVTLWRRNESGLTPTANLRPVTRRIIERMLDALAREMSR
ncbi:MAG: hypothetical protein ACYTGR_10230 [Planctomycetota bacterium]|jgi:hypothetical protein